MDENFDVTAVSDPVLSARYTAILDRAQKLAGYAQTHYGPGRGPIRCRFAKGRLFQASAGCEGNGYVITIGAAVPVLMMALFRKLLDEPGVFPAFPESRQEPRKDRFLSRRKLALWLTELVEALARCLKHGSNIFFAMRSVSMN